MSTPVRRRLLGRRRASSDGRMTLVEHLYELRARLFKALLGLVVGMIVGWLFFDQIFHVLQQPYCTLPASKRGAVGCHLAVFGVFDQFTVKLQVAFIAGLLLSSPIWMYQFWAFVTPGLHRNERRWALSFVGSSVALFGIGAALAYFLLGHALNLLLGVAGPGVTPVIELTRYLKYVSLMLVVFGAAFEFPLLVVMLNLAGVLSHERLARWRRAIIFGIFAFAAVVTPTQDPFTMTGLALAMVVLYEGALVLARVHDRRKARRLAAQGWGHLADDETSPLGLQPDSSDDSPSEPPRPSDLSDIS